MKNIGPWALRQSSHVYDNPWITVHEDSVLNPAGNPGIYGVVHFKNIAVGIIPLDADGNTVLVGQYRYPLQAYSWEIPMGGCPLGTSTEDTARRELEEETGLKAGSLEQILYVHTSNSVTDEAGYVFVARDLSSGNMAPEDTEELKLLHLSLDAAAAMAADGRITDAISVAGLLQLKNMLS